MRHKNLKKLLEDTNIDYFNHYYIQFLEKLNYEQYEEIARLKKENQMLRNTQKIEIINLGGDIE